jgi:hydroxymethylpyrimidine pyrophosphatase-like HAD family hydrolase
VLNGALAVDLGTGDRFHTAPYVPADATAVLRAYRAAGLEPCVYVDHAEVDVFVSGQPSTHPEHLAAFGPSAREADLEEIVQTVPVLMFGIMGHPVEPFAALAHALAATAETHVAGSDQYGGHSCTVTPAGLSKWIGVVAFCTRVGLDPERVLAIGDGPNDHELLAGAAIAVAPADGHPDLVRRAHHVVASPRAGGWAEILDLV